MSGSITAWPSVRRVPAHRRQIGCPVIWSRSACRSPDACLKGSLISLRCPSRSTEYQRPDPASNATPPPLTSTASTPAWGTNIVKSASPSRNLSSVTVHPTRAVDDNYISWKVITTRLVEPSLGTRSKCSNLLVGKRRYHPGHCYSADSFIVAGLKSLYLRPTVKQHMQLVELIGLLEAQDSAASRSRHLNVQPNCWLERNGSLADSGSLPAGVESKLMSEAVGVLQKVQSTPL